MGFARALLVASLATLAQGLATGCNPTAPGSSAKTVQVRDHAEPADVDGRVQAVTAPRPYHYGRVVVLAIGVSEYASPRIARLNYAAPDAEAIAARLRELYGFEAETLIGPNATKRGVEAALGRYSDHLAERDAMILYFAGHGQYIDLPSFGRSYYLIPFDADLDLKDRSNPELWARSALDADWLLERTRGMKARHVLLVADACFSGMLASRGLEDRADLRTLLARPSRSTLSATTELQTAGEDPNRNHGYFSAAFLDLLGEISRERKAASVTNLFDEVRKRVIRETMSRGGQSAMSPQMSTRGDGEFVFLPLSIPAEEIAGAGLDADRPDVGHPLVAGLGEDLLRLTARRTRLPDVVEAYQAPDYRFSDEPLERGERWRDRLRRFEENAGASDPLAMAGLHFCASRGLGMDRDGAAAFRWAQAAYRRDRDSGLGQFLLGRCYENGWGVGRNAAAAADLYRRSAELGSPFGKWEAARATLAGTGDEAAVAQARQDLEEAGSRGIAGAYERLAAAYSRGDAPGIPRDPGKAIDYYARAAEKGSLSARLALFKRLARPPVDDAPRAEAELKRAADGGLAEAQFRLAVELLPRAASPGRLASTARLSLAKDRGRAMALLDLAAQQGCGQAACLLATMYASPDLEGVTPDPGRAKAFNERSIAGGHAHGLTVRGGWYLRDDPDEIPVYPKDPKLAFESFRKAAALGDSTGCARLGDLFECGIGMDYPKQALRPLPAHYGGPEELVAPYYEHSHLALHWYVMALLNGGDEHAARRLVSFGSHLGLFRDSLRAGSRLRLHQEGELTEADILRSWRREDRSSLLGFFRLGFGLVPLREGYKANLGAIKDAKAASEGADLLLKARNALMAQYRRARAARAAEVEDGLSYREIDPREIDPADAVAALEQFGDHVRKLVQADLLKRETGDRYRAMAATAIRELSEGYDPYHASFIGDELRALPESIRRAGNDPLDGFDKLIEKRLMKEK